MNALSDGYRAGIGRLSLNLNPHPQHTPEHAEWQRGWQTATDLNASADWERMRHATPAPATSMNEPDWTETRRRDGEYHDASDVLEAHRYALHREAA